MESTIRMRPRIIVFMLGLRQRIKESLIGFNR